MCLKLVVSFVGLVLRIVKTSREKAEELLHGYVSTHVPLTERHRYHAHSASVLMGMLPTRRELLDLAVRAAALPGAAEFFATWLRAAKDHQHDSGSTGSTAPPEPPLLRDYKPQFFAPREAIT